MKAMQLPRKDYDVYFVPISGIKRREQRTFAAQQLILLHPGYDENSYETDFKLVRHTGTEWLLVTVIKKTLLEEYRILYPQTPFVTGAARAVYDPAFFTTGLQEYADELLRYDADRNMLSSEEKPAASTVKEQTVTHVLHKSIVYKNRPRHRKALLIAVMLFAMIIPAVFTVLRLHTVPQKNRPDMLPQDSSAALPVLPTAAHILEAIASRAVQTGIVLTQYRLQNGLLQCRTEGEKLEPLTTLLNGMPYTDTVSVQEITAAESSYAVRLSAVLTAEAVPLFTTAESTKAETVSAAHCIERLKKTVTKQNGRITALSLSGSTDFMITADIPVDGIDGFLHEAEHTALHYSFGIDELSISAQHDVLAVHIVYRMQEAHTPLFMPEGSIAIAQAFRKGSTVSDKKQTQKTAGQTTIPQRPKEQNRTSTIPEGSVQIGKIEKEGTVKTYYRTPDGKIVTAEK
ncbi:MAG: hypothetical protein P1P65_06235 [Treponema sp.]